MANNALAAIKQAAARIGVDWRALAAVSHFESGLNPGAIGDGGHAFGLFQLNNAGGTITGNANPRQYLDPYKNANFAADAISKLGISGLTPQQQITQIVRRFERPQNPDREVQGALDWFKTNFGNGANPTQTQVPGPKPKTVKTKLPTTQAQIPQVQPLQSNLKPQTGGPGANPMLAFLMTNAATARSGQDPNAGLVSFLMSNGAGAQQPVQTPQTPPQQVTQQQPVAQIPTTNPKKKPVTVVADKGAGANPAANTIIEHARQFLGTPYKWGGANPKTGFDCSGFVQWLYGQQGIALPRTTYQQINVGKHVDQAHLQPGDIIFFSNKGDVHHEGLYIGNGQFIHAPHTGDVIKISNLSDPYYAQQFAGGRRVTK